MKLVFLGDLHLRSSTPAKRVDNFSATQRNKLARVLEIGKENLAPIIQTGDMFDIEEPPYGLVNDYLDMLNGYDFGFYAVPGNHDVYGADLGTLHRTAFQTLVAGGAVVPLGHEPQTISYDVQPIHLYGHTYMHREKCPEPPTDDAFKILVAHEMVLVDKIWREQEDFRYASDYLKIHSGWDVVLCGHYHYQFALKSGKRHIINPGALVRIKRSKGDMAMEPSVVLFDTDTREYERISIGAAPVAEVFEMDPDGKPPVVNMDLEAFVNALAETSDSEISEGSLADVLLKILGESGCSEEVAALVKKFIGMAQQDVQ